MEMSISINNVSKSYKKHQALKTISLEIGKGELFGLIGSDGAGKTTLLRIIATLLLPDKGIVKVEGFDTVRHYNKIRNMIGYMPSKFSLYQDLSIQENLIFFSQVFNISPKENDHTIRNIYRQLEPFKNRKVGKLSGGMKQKLALCCALIHKPKVLFLDEPTTGVDPISRKEFWEILKRLKERQITILVSTSYMDEANLCDRIALIQQGEMMSINTPEKIIEQYPKKIYSIKVDNKYQLLNELRKEKNVDSVYIFGDSLHITFKNHPLNIDGLKEIKPNIEDCFIKLMTKKKEKG